MDRLTKNTAVTPNHQNKNKTKQNNIPNYGFVKNEKAVYPVGWFLHKLHVSSEKTGMSTEQTPYTDISQTVKKKKKRSMCPKALVLWFKVLFFFSCHSDNEGNL